METNIRLIDKDPIKRTETYHAEAKNGIPIEGIWLFHGLHPEKCKIHGHLTDDELTRIYSTHYRAYIDKQTPNKLPACCFPTLEARKNTVVDGLINTMIHRMINDFTGTEDLIARKLSIGTSNVASSQTNAQLGLEIFRSDFTEKFQDGNKASFVLLVNRTSGNGHETLIQADAGNTLTTFKVTTSQAALFNVGDRIRINTLSTEHFTDIIDKDNGTDFITISTPLPELPIAGKRVIQAWAEAGVFGNSNTGVSFNTGTLFNRVNQLEFVKDNTKIILIEVNFIFTAA